MIPTKAKIRALVKEVQTKQAQPARLANAIHTIFPYKKGGQWMFDDARVGLVEEAFVAGADEFLDRACDALGINERARKKGVKVLFSTTKFPGSAQLEKVGGGPDVGTDYITEDPIDGVLRVWLCPALNLYYPQSPKNLYVQVSKKRG